MGSAKERARSVVGLLTSLGLSVPAATSAGCAPVPRAVGTENRAPYADVPYPDAGPVGTENPVIWDSGMDAPEDAEGPRWDAPTIENFFPWDDGVPDAGVDEDAPLDDAPADDAAVDDDAGASG